MELELKYLIELFFIVTIPQTGIVTWFSLQFFGVVDKSMTRRILLYTSGASILLIASMGTMPPVAHPLIGMTACFLSMLFFFRNLSWKTCLFITISNYLTNILTEFATVLVSPPFGGPTVLREGPFYYKMLIWLPLGLFAAAAWTMARSGVSPGRRVMLYFQDDRNRVIRLYVSMIFLQCFTLILLFMARYLFMLEKVTQVLFVCCIVIVMFSAFMAVRLIAKARDEAIHKTQEAFAGDLMQMLTTIRGQRHDFANHVQVMHSMLKMKKMEQLEAYMAEVAGELQSINRVADQFPTSAFGSFLQAKAANALERKIRFEYDLVELPSTLSAVKNIDLVRIVGNLVDNAFDEVMKRPENQRVVTLQIETKPRELVIRVGNAGEPLSEEMKRHIFTPGYSTKQGGHSGLGLPIVVERTRHYGGTVDVGYEPARGVVFTVAIPVGAGGSAG